jgi:hypothetical protein
MYEKFKFQGLSKYNQNRRVWFENKLSGNPGTIPVVRAKLIKNVLCM